ncbi:MAG: hypothetical protein PF689_06650 [Deltaproteobacteria bacterium]|nr:hypothetical protein [Deltaproteobacteria bacterium]
MTDFSELQEAAQLLKKIRPDLDTHKQISTAQLSGSFAGKPDHAKKKRQKPQSKTSQSSVTKHLEVGIKDYQELKYTDEKLEHLLKNMCLRGNFSHALLADENGLTLAEYGQSYQYDKVTALGSILAASLEQGKKLFDSDDNVNIVLELNLLDMAVLRSFNVKQGNFYLLVIAPQEIDVKKEVKLSMQKIAFLLGSN